jgi:hypothetical protein
LWIFLSRFWRDWRSALAIIKPETVLAWHRAGFRPVVQVVQLESPLERLSDCRTVPYLRFFLVRNEEAGGSNPLSSTTIINVYAGF